MKNKNIVIVIIGLALQFFVLIGNDIHGAIILCLGGFLVCWAMWKDHNED